MIVLGHYNDDKEKSQSHEIYLGYIDDDKVHSMENDEGMRIVGYGESKEEALANMREEFNKFYSKLEAFKITLDRGVAKTIEVNCVGRATSK